MNNEIKPTVFDILKFHKIDERVDIKIELEGNNFIMRYIKDNSNVGSVNGDGKESHCLYFCDKNGEFYYITKETFEAFSKRLSDIEKENLKIKIEGYAYKKLRVLNDVCGKHYTTITYEPRMADFSTMQVYGYSMCDEGIVL